MSLASSAACIRSSKERSWVLGLIIANPDPGKALKDELRGLRSFRVGKFRIVYKISRRTIEVVAVGPRSKIYEETLRLVRPESD
jgi:mRNA interferase RelE/StbE